MRQEHKEAVRAVAKYREDLFNCRDEPKEANEMVKRCNNSIRIMEKEREHARAEINKARVEPEKALRELRENEKALANVVWERNTLKVQVVGIGALVAQAREEVVHEYKANFTDTDDYLDLMRDSTMEHKKSLKQVTRASMLIVMTGSSLVSLKPLFLRTPSGLINLIRSGLLGL